MSSMKRGALSISIKERLFILFMLTEVIGPLAACPSQCHQIACTTGVLTCPDGGLDQIPTSLPPGTSKILLTNHRFYNGQLTYFNFSNHGPPQFQLIKITIQNCGLVSISPSTFSHLTALSILDLANNRLAEIVPDTFNSLTLSFLRLDGNKNIVLHDLSFRGLTLSTLSLIDCSLTHINVGTIDHMLVSLKNLFLTNNRLRTIDRSFKHIFEQLTVLQINDNPINCTCDLQWLSSVLLWRRKHKNAVESSGVLSEPQCQSPPTHHNKLLINLSSKDLNCQLPQLKFVDVHMTSNNSATLTCTSEPFDEPTVQWLYGSKAKLFPESTNKGSAALSVFGSSRVDQFVCVISNGYGNVTVLVNIEWASLGLNASHSTQINGIPVPPLTNDSSNSDYMYVKRFTLLEMVGGVIGTFTLTMVLFLCIYKGMMSSVKRDHEKKWYMAYEPTMGSDGQTYDVPNCTYYAGRLFSNHNGLMRYIDVNSDPSISPIKTAVL